VEIEYARRLLETIDAAARDAHSPSLVRDSSHISVSVVHNV
jgi:hypothetical protein